MNVCHHQVQNFDILNLYEQNQNFGVIFRKYRKQNRKSTKYFETSRKPSVIPLKFHEMSLVAWNLSNYCKILQFLIKFYKIMKDLWKILLKWLGKTVKYCLNFVNFHSCTEKWAKVGQILSITLMKVYNIPRRFSHSQTFSFNEILSCFVLFMTKIFHFMKILQLPKFESNCCLSHREGEKIARKEEKMVILSFWIYSRRFSIFWSNTIWLTDIWPTTKDKDDPVPNGDFPVLHCLGIVLSLSGIVSDHIRKYLSKI